MNEQSSELNNETISLELKQTLLESYAILAKTDKVLDRPQFKKIKKQALCAVLYELSTNNVEIPQLHQQLIFSDQTYKAIFSFFLAQNIVGTLMLLSGLILSISSFLLLNNFTDFRASSTASISIGMLLVFYFLKKHMELKIYERFIFFLKNLQKKSSV